MLHLEKHLPHPPIDNQAVTSFLHCLNYDFSKACTERSECIKNLGNLENLTKIVVQTKNSDEIKLNKHKFINIKKLKEYDKI